MQMINCKNKNRRRKEYISRYTHTEINVSDLRGWRVGEREPYGLKFVKQNKLLI